MVILKERKKDRKNKWKEKCVNESGIIERENECLEKRKDKECIKQKLMQMAWMTEWINEWMKMKKSK